MSKLPKLVNEKHALSIAGTDAMRALRSSGVQLPVPVHVTWRLDGAVMHDSLRSKAAACPQVNAKCKLLGISQVLIHGLVLQQATLDARADPPTVQLELVHPTAALVAQLAPPSVAAALPEHLRARPPEQVLQWLRPLLKSPREPPSPQQQQQTSQQHHRPPSNGAGKGRYVNRNLWVPKELVERLLTAEEVAQGEPRAVPLRAVVDGVYLPTSNERVQLRRDSSGGWVIRLTRKDHAAILGKEKVAWHVLPRSSPLLLQWRVPAAEQDAREGEGLVLELARPAPATPPPEQHPSGSCPPSPERTWTAEPEPDEQRDREGDVDTPPLDDADAPLEPCRLFAERSASPSCSVGSTDTWSTAPSDDPGSDCSSERDVEEQGVDRASLRLLTVQQLQQRVRERRDQLVQALQSLADAHEQRVKAQRQYDDLLEAQLDMDTELAEAMDPADERQGLYEQLDDLAADTRGVRGQERAVKRRLADTRWRLADLRQAARCLSDQDVDRAVAAAAARRRAEARRTYAAEEVANHTAKRRRASAQLNPC